MKRIGFVSVFAAALIFIAALITGGPAFADGRNHLGDESSPYLQLHTSDPVYWHAWNAETLAEAKAAGKPILLSIGYSACHWCHVMRRGAFADKETSDVINRLFFPILLDREERPDIDSIFQSAAAALSLPTGWPLNMFLTPNAKPFWGGTYFPKDAFRGMKPFKEILKQVAGIYNDDPNGVEVEAQKVAQFLKKSSEPGPGTITPEKTDAAARSFLKRIDPFHGGFGEGPKFPYTVALEMLWRAGIRTGDKAFADAVTSTLDAMGRGGIYDHVGGGFFRYAVDPRWLVPHYEKMLDVNAALVRLMTDVWRETGDGALKRTITETVNFLLDEMRLSNGAFAGSLDADSLAGGSLAGGEEMEGAFYLWSEKEILQRLGGDGPLMVAAYGLAAPENALDEDLGDAGTLYRSEQPIDMLAETFKLSRAEIQKRLRDGLAALKQHRETRPRPRRDDKIIADWSGMAIAAIAEAGLAFENKDWASAAIKAFDATVRGLTDAKGRLRHSALGQTQGAPATLRDYAEMSRSALILLEATGDKKYLGRASEWVKQAEVHLWDKSAGGFFSAALDAGPSLVRLKPVMDNPNTSGNAKMAEVLAILYYLSGDADFLDLAIKTLQTLGGVANEPILEASGLFNAADALDATLQIVIVGGRGDAATDKLIRRVMTTSLPNRALDVIAPGTVLPEGHPARYKDQLDGKATAYVCRGTICSLPVTEIPELVETLSLMRQAGKY